MRPPASGAARATPLSAVVGLLRGAVLLVLTLVAAVPFGLLVLLWRLEQGPADIDWALGLLSGRLTAAEAGQGTARLVPALGHATLQWRGFSTGPDAGLELRVASVALRTGDDATPLSAGPVAATIPVGSLLLGEPVPSSVSVGTLDLHLVNDAGGLRLDGTPPGHTPATEQDGSAPPAWLARLRHLQLGAATITLRDADRGTATLQLGALDLRQDAGGAMRGATAGTLAYGAAQAGFSIEAERAGDGTATVALVLSPLSVDALAAAVPGMLPPGTMDAPVSGRATLRLDAAARPRSLDLRLEAGPGRVRVGDRQLRFTAAAADAQASWTTPAWNRPDRLAVSAARAVLPSPGRGPDTAVTARLDVAGSAILSGSAELAIDQVAFADLPALWPEGVAHHVRPWLTRNITAGTARDASVRIGFEAPADLTGFRLRTIDGRLVGDDLTIHWLRPVPPVEHASALLTIAAPDRLDIAITTGRQGGVPLRTGAIRITGLDVKDQFLTVALDMAGGVPELLTLLRHPRLNLLSRQPLPMRNPAGTFDGHLAVDLPLNHDVRFDQVSIATQTRFSGLHLGGLLAGRDLDGGEVALDATADGLHASGRAKVGGIPSRLSVAMDFRSGPPDQVVQSAQLQARATPAQLAAAGLDPAPVMQEGTVAISAQYEERRNGAARLRAVADASAAGLALAGWRKPPGPPAEIAASIVLDHGRLAGIEEVHASGPGMLLDATVHPVDGRPLDLELHRLVLGRTEATGSLRLPSRPGDAIVARLSGPTLDLSTQFGRDAEARDGARDARKPDRSGTPFVADIRFDRVLLARGTSVGSVTGHAEHDGRRLTALHVATGGPERVEADIRPDGTGRRVTLRAADAGAALRALDVTDAVRGGTLRAEGMFDDRLPRSPLSGRAEMGAFHVGKGVVIGKLLQALTLYGLPDALSGPGVLFDRLLLPFRWDGTVLQVSGARAFSSSLGLTAEGTLDNGRNALDLRGTVVPAYMLNSLLGRIPGIGRLFSAEQGGGLVALDWSLRGPADDPAARVNPLSLLTPGILRNIFN